jgi:hypothetical protein
MIRLNWSAKIARLPSLDQLAPLTVRAVQGSLVQSLGCRSGSRREKIVVPLLAVILPSDPPKFAWAEWGVPTVPDANAKLIGREGNLDTSARVSHHVRHRQVRQWFPRRG